MLNRNHKASIGTQKSAHLTFEYLRMRLTVRCHRYVIVSVHGKRFVRITCCTSDDNLMLFHLYVSVKGRHFMLAPEAPLVMLGGLYRYPVCETMFVLFSCRWPAQHSMRVQRFTPDELTQSTLRPTRCSVASAVVQRRTIMKMVLRAKRSIR